MLHMCKLNNREKSIYIKKKPDLIASNLNHLLPYKSMPSGLIKIKVIMIASSTKNTRKIKNCLAHHCCLLSL